MERKLTTNQLKRMPSYLDLLRRLANDGIKYISCQTIADCLSLNKEQVRKDIALVSQDVGVPNKGRKINDLIKDIEIVLGLNNDYCAVLIGVGSLGTALLNYGGFTNYGLKIIAAFDNKVELINKEVNGIKVYDINYLKDYIANENVHIGIITVPRDYAQDVADLLVEAGIEAIWNFAPVSLVVKEGVIVSNMDMAQSLATLSHKLYLKQNRG